MNEYEWDLKYTFFPNSLLTVVKKLLFYYEILIWDGGLRIPRTFFFVWGSIVPISLGYHVLNSLKIFCLKKDI